MKKFLVPTLVVGLLVVAGMFYFSPWFRLATISTAESITTWTPEAIEKNPIGYSQFVEAQLKKDLRVLQDTRKMLTLRMDTLAKRLIDKTKLLNVGQELADEFANAITENVFPVTLHGKEYTESQLRIQLALTLAQVTGLKESVAEIEKVSQVAEQEIQKLVVNVEKTESQIALLATRREVFRSQSTSTEGLTMIANINALLEGNQIIIRDNPVRTIEEILNENTPQGLAASDTQVESYLTDYTTKKSSKKGSFLQTDDIPQAPGDEVEIL